MKKMIAWTDGGSRGNGNEDAIGGWGVLLKCGANEKQIKGSAKGVTNNQMELMACIKALETIKHSAYPVEIHTDSAYLCNCMNQKWYEKWRKNGWKNSKKQSVENKELWEQILNLIETKQFNIKFIKVKGHSDNEGNIIADRLVNEAMDELEVELKELGSAIGINERLKRVDDYFDNISSEEFDKALVKAGVTNTENETRKHINIEDVLENEELVLEILEFVNDKCAWNTCEFCEESESCLDCWIKRLKNNTLK